MYFKFKYHSQKIMFFFYQQSEIEQIEKSERVGGVQQHKRITAALGKQIQQQTSKLEEVNCLKSKFLWQLMRYFVYFIC